MNLQRFFRYILLFGLRRAIVKAAYHLNNTVGFSVLKLVFLQPFKVKSERVVLAGLGNHGFTLIAYCVLLVARRRVSAVIDPSDRALYLAKNILRCPCFKTLESAKKSGEFYGDILYICSDHRTHLIYAKAAIGNFSSVYIEKPIIVSNDQMEDLAFLTNNKLKIFTGYNRPNAPFIKKLMLRIGIKYSITFVVNGHFLPSDHWYRNNDQGTRVLGNLSHWLDLSYKLFSLTNAFKKIDIYLVKGYLDDITVILKQVDQTISIVFSANLEPLNGVEEFLYWNSNVSLGVINNFRQFDSVSWKKKETIRNLNKNVGHVETIISPFEGDEGVDQHLLNSARFCLHVEEMALKNISHSVFLTK